MKILVMGLPGSGKTTFAKKLLAEFQFSKLEFKFNHISWLNADQVRKDHDDWDFSTEGRIRQSLRMKMLADTANAWNHLVIVDFICPTVETRKNFNADMIVFMDTISKSQYEDTNSMFDRNVNADYNVTNWNQEGEIIEQILHKCVSMGI